MTAPTTGPRIKVLIAEDEEHLGTILEQFLLGRGYQVTVTRDGKAALAALRSANSITEGKRPRGGATGGGRPPRGVSYAGGCWIVRLLAGRLSTMLTKCRPATPIQRASREDDRERWRHLGTASPR